MTARDLASHLLEEVERVADHVTMIHQGKVVFSCELDDLKDTYRRLTLHDPHLPAALLPADWPGHAAYQLCRRLYQRTYRQSREFLLPRFAASARKAPAAGEVARRFGGLD